MPMPKKPEPPDRSPVIETYLNEHKKRQKEAQQGIDYRSAMRRGQLTLWTFGSLVSKTLGKSGGLSSFNVHEQLTLETFIAVESATSFRRRTFMMTHLSYLEHFKLRSQPFMEHASSDSLWKDSRMDEGLSRLGYLVQSGVLGLVTGASGLGKSALLKRFMAEQSPQHCLPIYCHLAQLPSNGLLKVILTSLGENPKRGKDKLYSQILERARRVEGTLLLVFDEAHLLSGEALVDLRLLVSSALDRGPSLKILLAGQDHLRGTLKRIEYTDIVNRISVRYQLRALTKDQTHRYIDHQMKVHGGDVKTFDESAKDQIHEFTGGNPRSINNASIACLMSATGKGQLRIDEELFRSIQNELVLH